MESRAGHPVSGEDHEKNSNTTLDHGVPPKSGCVLCLRYLLCKHLCRAFGKDSHVRDSRPGLNLQLAACILSIRDSAKLWRVTARSVSHKGLRSNIPRSRAIWSSNFVIVRFATAHWVECVEVWSLGTVSVILRINGLPLLQAKI